MQNHSEAEKCLELCSKELENSASSFEIKKLMAFACSKSAKKQDESIKIISEAITNSDDIDCYLEIAQLQEGKKPAESLALYEKLLSFLNTGNSQNTFEDKTFENLKDIKPELLINIASLKLRMKELNKTEEYLNEALKIVKHVLEKEEKEEKCLKEEKELKVEESSNNLKDQDTTKKIRFKALELSIYFNLAIYNELKHEFGEAYCFYKKLLKLNPNFTEAYMKLGELAKLRGNEKKFHDYLDEAISKHYQVIEAKDNRPKEIPAEKKLIFPSLLKPINPKLIKIQSLLDSGKEDEAIKLASSILDQYNDKDCYTQILLGNIFYKKAFKYRIGIMQDKNRTAYFFHLNKALELYHQALENDKYNCYAAIGIANILAEYNLTKESHEIYKTVSDFQPNNINSTINEALIYMNENQFEKAIINLNKVLKKNYNGLNPEIEVMLIKCYRDNKDFNIALKMIKSLMFRYPDNLIYKINYALTLKIQAEEILGKNERKTDETEEAIKNLDEAIPIFMEITQLKRDVKDRIVSDFKIITVDYLRTNCSEFLDFTKDTKGKAEEILKSDRIQEERTTQKNKENKKKWESLLLDEKRTLEEKQEIELRKQLENEEDLAKELEDKALELFKIQTKKKSKGGKKKKDEENQIIDDTEQNNNEGNYDGAMDNEDNESVKTERTQEDANFEDFDNSKEKVKLNIFKSI